ncbi:MAG: ribosome maturation factor RimP [Clostridiales bacterium]|nr:ribosome maturation factor RimP [Clostridiales bacterium]
MSKITDMLTEISASVLKELGLELWDTEYVKEAGGWYLRLLVDAPDGVDLERCEKVVKALNPMLDEREDMFPDGGYVFEVGSAGAERRLKRPSDFERYIGHKVEIRLYKGKFGKREHIGTLESYREGAVTLDCGGEKLDFEKQEIANARLRI